MGALYYETSNELYHHGVKGMKWGVRRYQNPDGSLTAAGKRRRAKQDAKQARKEAKQKTWSDDARDSYKIRQKKVNQMSNTELKKVNERRQLERNYEQLNPSKFQKAVKFVGGAVALTGSVLALQSNSAKLIKLGQAGIAAVSGVALSELDNISIHLDDL